MNAKEKENAARKMVSCGDLSGVFRLFDLEDFEKELRSLAKPAIRLHISENVVDEAELAESKIGGQPDLPDGTVWPTNNAGKPLAFLCQINLQEITVVEISDCLGRSGLLSFFYESEEQPWGYDPESKSSWKVIFTQNVESLSKQNPPLNLPSECIFQETPVWFSEIITLTYPAAEMMPEQRDRFFALQEALSGPSFDHRLLGHPDTLQDDFRLQCQLVSQGVYCGDGNAFKTLSPAEQQEAKDKSLDWILLLQMDSAQDLGIDWGLGGVLYFAIKKQDLAKRNFDDVWLVLQTT